MQFGASSDQWESESPGRIEKSAGKEASELGRDGATSRPLGPEPQKQPVDYSQVPVFSVCVSHKGKCSIMSIIYEYLIGRKGRVPSI